MTHTSDPTSDEQKAIVASLEKCFAVSGHDEAGVTISWADAEMLANECERNSSSREPDFEAD